MRRTVPLLVALTVVLLAAASAAAAPWKRHTSKKLGFSMLVPRGATIADRTWPGGWVGMEATRKGIKLIGVTVQGKKTTADLIRARAEQITAVERKHWTVNKTYKARNGWAWFTVARAVHGEKVVVAVYGLGRKGTYLMLLITHKARARKHRAAHVKWSRAVRLK